MTGLISFVSLVFLVCLFVSSSRVDSLGFHHARIESSSSYLTKDEHWFNQNLDHFSPTVRTFCLLNSLVILGFYRNNVYAWIYVIYMQDHRQFKQRYFEFFDYYRADGPIFLRICGESACNGITNDYSAVSPFMELLQFYAQLSKLIININ